MNLIKPGRKIIRTDSSKGTTLKIIIKGGLWYYQSLPNGPVNWTITDYDFNLQQQTFTSTESGKSCDLIIQFDPSIHTFEYYENNSTIPTRTKIYKN